MAKQANSKARATRKNVHMRGAEEIAAVFGVHVKTVREWKADGAPIMMLGKKYQANYYDLWEWLKGKTVEG